MDELDELNSKIEDLLGWKFDGKNWRGPGGSVWEEHKNYARDIAAAWELMAEMEADEQEPCIYHSPGIIGWVCSFTPRTKYVTIGYHGETAPEAICRAWLAWKEAQG